MSWSIPSDVVPNTAIAAATTNAILADLRVIGGAWTSYTPTVAAGGTAITLGNGSLDAAYKMIGDKTCVFRVTLVVGSSTSLGTGTVTVTLPVSAKSTTNGLAPGSFATLSPNGAGVWLNTSQTQVSLLLAGATSLGTIASLGLVSGTVVRLGGTFEVA